METENQEINQNEENSSEEEKSFEELMTTFKRFNNGEIVQGRVIRVGSDEVVLDISYKSEGIIPLREFEDISGNLNVKVGDEVKVLIKNINGPDGLVVLSKRSADEMTGWTRLRDIAKNDEIIKGKIVKEIKGGYWVDLGGLGGFLPASQASLSRRTRNPKMIGSELEFKIIKIDKGRKDVVVSHRVLAVEKQKEEREALLQTINVDQIIEGRVKSLTAFGAFVSLGAIDGLLHIKDMSWGRIKHPRDKVKVGDQLKAKVINFDREQGKISLSIKELCDDPWSKVSFRYPVGEKIRGKIVSLTDYGAFVELEEGVEGLIHVSEMSWTKRINRPSDILKTDQEVEAIILDVKVDERRISLGLKQITKDPWVELAEKYPVGSTINGKVCNLTGFGVFIEIAAGIDGLVRLSELSWDGSIKDASDVLKVGDETEAVILSFDVEKRKIALGIKQMSEDPWKQLQRKYSVGKEVKAKVVQVVDFGAFVELEEGVEGFVHVSQLEVEKVSDPRSCIKVDEERIGVITKFDLKGRKISLSFRDYLFKQEKKDISKYTKESDGFFSVLGELANGALQNHSLVLQSKSEEEE